MKNPRKILWLIIGLTLISLLIDLPRFPLKFSLGPAKLDTQVGGYNLDFDLFGWRIFRELPIKLGLDLQGGTHLVLEAQMKNIESRDRSSALEAAKNIIERRVNLYGVSEPVVQTAKVGESYRIVVELAGIRDVSSAIDLIGKTAQLEFREPEETIPEATLSAFPQNFKPTGLTGKDLRRAAPSFNTQTGQPEVTLEFTDEGAKKFEEITRKNVGKPVAIYLDEEIITAPRVNEVISGGRAEISGQFTTEETRALAIQLNAGALPAPIKILEQRTIGPTLGQISLQKSLVAGVIGLFLVVIFMILYYGAPGVLASLALLIYTLLILAIFKLIPVTLTLAGIAGFVLSIGMAVDANILIFERMREEIRWGRKKKEAVELGFARAWTSIRDSNVSSLITCGILYWFGTGAVRGFALTLAIGILISMFSAITVTRTFLRLIVKS